MENMDILTKLEEYSKADYVPMHMPGGKRNTEYASTSVLDITEIDGFDNMHNAEGIIKNASFARSQPEYHKRYLPYRIYERRKIGSLERRRNS